MSKSTAQRQERKWYLETVDSKRSQATNPNQQYSKSLGLNLLLMLGAHGHGMPVACNAGVLVS
jgi:hypothetical protein